MAGGGEVKGRVPGEGGGRGRNTLRLELERLRAEDADGAFGALTLSSGSIREEDWANEWKRYFKPFRVGRHLVVKPTWETWDAAPDDLIIEIDPGMAFGTGTHETTALCIELIERYYQSGRLLDIGTGSGILAIAAALLGAKDVRDRYRRGRGARGAAKTWRKTACPTEPSRSKRATC